MKSKEVKLNITPYFENNNYVCNGEDLITPGVWALITIESDTWNYADIKIINPKDASENDIESPSDMLVCFKEQLGFPNNNSGNGNFHMVWENGTKSNEDTKIDEKGLAEVSYGGYGDSGIAIQINTFIFKDVTLENLKSIVESKFKNMRKLVAEIENIAADDDEYAKNPSAYYGVSNSDFISPSDFKNKKPKY